MTSSTDMSLKRLLTNIILVLLLFALPSQAAAFSLFPGESFNDYREFILAFYVFVIPASALVGVVLIMIAGIIWVTSAGSQQRIATAKELIINSIIGMVLLMGSYIILGFINPNLVILSMPNIEIELGIGACDLGVKTDQQGNATDRICEFTTKEQCQQRNGTFVAGTECGDIAEQAIKQCAEKTSKSSFSVRHGSISLSEFNDRCQKACSPCHYKNDADERFSRCTCIP